MSKWLASVQSLEEAQSLLPVLPDILDMKNPAEGALGALSAAKVTEIVTLIAGRCQTSATIGDLPMQAAVIESAMIEMAASGVDYVKIGLFPDANLTNCIVELADIVSELTIPVIAVLFADHSGDRDCLPRLRASGFAGVMVDTAVKNGQHLLDHWNMAELKGFVDDAHHLGLICGLAGALRFEHIAVLTPLGADYLGFRSALCLQQQRTSILQPALARQIQREVNGQTSWKCIIQQDESQPTDLTSPASTC